LPDVIKTPAFSTDPAQTWLKLPAPIILAEDFALIYEATNNFNDEQFIRWDTDSGTNGTEGWNRLTGGGGIGTCLIDETFWRDDFADTYTVTVGSTTGTVTRESLCVWRGLTTDGCPIVLSYDRGVEGIEIDAAALKWAINITFFDPDFGCENSSIFVKTVQNSPVGSDYINDNIFSSLTATVS
jgi:hypothetical protein